MIEKVIAALTVFIISSISTLGLAGVALMMAIESACIPLPSEVIMPFSGYLVATGRFTLQGVAIAGAIGCLLGSYAAYYVGATGGRRFLLRYGRWVLIAPHELETADRFFSRWGSSAVFVSRLLPVVRTFIAFPAGVARMELWRFSIYTLAGSYLWCLALAYAGMKAGQHWSSFAPIFHRFDTAIGVVLVLGAAAFLYFRIKAIRAGASHSAAPEESSASQRKAL